MKFVLLLELVSITLARPWCIDDYDEYNIIVIDSDVHFGSDENMDIFGSCEDDSSHSVYEDHDDDGYEYTDPGTFDEKPLTETDDHEYYEECI
uniref:Secreted protein n=1 Tax=Angiostrongylus cantonensis TaxID=6313 RepID=A0A0K0D7R7_ANGCA